MSAHAIIALVILYAAVRAIFRRKPKHDPTCGGRIVPRPYALDMEAMKAEGSRRQRAADAWAASQWEARVRFDEWQGEIYKRQCAMKAWHAGYGEHP